MMRKASVVTWLSFIKSHLEQEGAHVAGLGVAGKAEIAKGIHDVFIIIAFNRVDAVAVMSQHQVCPGVNGGPAQVDLVLLGL